MITDYNEHVKAQEKGSQPASDEPLNQAQRARYTQPQSAERQAQKETPSMQNLQSFGQSQRNR